MSTGAPAVTTRFEEVLALGDDALIAAQRLAQWSARAHDMEEDVALTNIALDQLGVARLLLTYAGELPGAVELALPGIPAGDAGPRTEDQLAYLREDRQFRNALLVELPNGDFAMTMGKLLFLAAYQCPRYAQLAAGGDERLAGIGAKAVKETRYHFEHASLWTIRLGDGTEESHRRMQAAVDELWPYTYELFEGNDLRPAWLAAVEQVLAEATLTRPADGGWAPRGGRDGRHTEHLSYLLAEMQVLHRAHPGATW